MPNISRQVIVAEPEMEAAYCVIQLIKINGQVGVECSYIASASDPRIDGLIHKCRPSQQTVCFKPICNNEAVLTMYRTFACDVFLLDNLKKEIARCLRISQECFSKGGT